ncbi:hypothetical protein AMECASPLE_018769 [Ameca splendens]|uniref:Uncharacterized protein n=1 Tax=Ameca splendens TaxID=208324 RepID=A0ABV0Z0V1_9TELE
MCRESAVLSGFSEPQPPGQLTAGEHFSVLRPLLLAFERSTSMNESWDRVGHGGYTGPILQIRGKGHICWNLGDWTAFVASSRMLSAYKCVLQKNAVLNLDTAMMKDIRESVNLCLINLWLQEPGCVTQKTEFQT